MSSQLVKLGPWGGDHGGSEHDVASSAAPHRLESVSLRRGKVIDCIGFTYLDKDGNRHAVGPWGGGGGEPETVALGPSEHVTEVHGSVGPIGDYTHVVTSLKLVTNLRTVGPFGNGAGTPFAVPVLGDGSVVGFFARAGLYLEAIGVYVRPSLLRDEEDTNKD